MKKVLITQNTTIGGHDILVIDGNVSVFQETEEQRNAMALSNEDKANQIIIPSFIMNKKVSSNFRFYETKEGGFIIISNFITKDEVGRHAAYSYYCNTMKNPTLIRREFEDYCTIANMEPNPYDCDLLENILKYYPIIKRSKIISFFAFFVILLSVLGLLKGCPSNSAETNVSTEITTSK